MRTHTQRLAVLAVLVIMALCAGCQEPGYAVYAAWTAEIYPAYQTYTSVAIMFIRARQRDEIPSDVTWARILQFDRTAHAELQAYERTVLAGRDARAARGAFEAAIDRLLLEYELLHMAEDPGAGTVFGWNSKRRKRKAESPARRNRHGDLPDGRQAGGG